MNSNRIFIFEFVSGGGFNQIGIPSSLFCEGYGMLRAIIADFKAMDFEITTLLDERISFLSHYLETDSLQYIKASDNFLKAFKESVKNCDSAFIIAPEFSNILYDLTKIVKKEHKKLLSTDLKGIELGSSKVKTHEYFRTHKIKTPKTYPIPLKNGFDVDFIAQKFEEFNSPIIIKPLDGVGAESIYFFEEKKPERYHAAKPDKMYDIIEANSYHPYIELFATIKRPYWESLGFDLSGRDIREELLYKMKNNFSEI